MNHVSKQVKSNISENSISFKNANNPDSNSIEHSYSFEYKGKIKKSHLFLKTSILYFIQKQVQNNLKIFLKRNHSLQSDRLLQYQSPLSLYKLELMNKTIKQKTTHQTMFIYHLIYSIKLIKKRNQKKSTLKQIKMIMLIFVSIKQSQKNKNKYTNQKSKKKKYKF
ncbi:hypothetical protein TTHERM_000136238 (macronuclear) [Tetrahymena thermophila SB210]|uniref:Uncharacterized protein n=1 Tax=Tetrahymena thermophila (strain SB210) TaxID=312017 RepID=W7XAP4_TETTS|nr:hypothetical protein TTHERM_000136238 [Tetrahymena thermophila SB210]EWS73488.1 hypothetical protein TTHERM_000136238 [Tetrahymena thermophila SB210]|eukprot:XP_012653970.1 hypothetical protein TTHERM_000136238 [Tetrahymena thermophila SB210]